MKKFPFFLVLLLFVFSVAFAQRSAAGRGCAKLSDTRSNGCSASIPAKLEEEGYKVCSGATEDYWVSRHPGSSYSWETSGGTIIMGAGTDSISILWGSSGTGSVQVIETVENGCTDTSLLTVLIMPRPDAHWKAISLGSQNFSFLSDDSSLPASSYRWDFGDGTNPVNGFKATHVYKTVAPHTVSLTVANKNCSDLFDSTVYLNTLLVQDVIKASDLNIRPNPFYDRLVLEYSLSASSHIIIGFYSMEGKKLAGIAEGQESAGYHSHFFDASGYNVPAGIYILKMQVDDKAITRQVIRVR